MRYKLELDINAPRERVVEIFLDPQHLPKWQPDLVRFEAVGGKAPREVGARSRQIHKMGKREVEIIETITVHNYPDKFAAIYEADNVRNLIENHFIDVGAHKTKWILRSECRFSSVLMKLLVFFLPGMFKQQTLTFMHRFKEFAEKSGV